MPKLALIRRAINTVTDLIGKPTPERGTIIDQGANELKKIGHTLNGVAATVIGAITLSDFELLYSWWEKDKVFFSIVLAVMQAPYVVATYLKIAAKVQASE
ncbi:MAG: hypothetical protein LAT57_00045 [Balneolales bacterium]|nr:hypothetical protein [Balneolales bacterium]